MQGSTPDTGARRAKDLSEPKAALKDAARFHGRGDLRRAIGVLRRAAERFPHNFDLVYNLGELYREVGDCLSAARYLEVATTLDPADASAHFCLGAALHDAGDLEGAIDAYREALRRDPADSEAANNLGASLADARRFTEAIEVLEAVCRRYPRFVGAWQNLVRSHLGNDDEAEALATLSDAITGNVGAAPLYFSLGWIHLRAGRCADAATALLEATCLDPTNREYVDAACRALESAEKPRAALEVLDRARVLAPKRFPRDQRHARLLAACGQADTAKALFQSLSAASPDDPAALTGYADFLIREGDYQQARTLLDRAIERDAGNVAAVFNRAIVDQIEGNFDAAAQGHREALALNPRLGRAALNLSVNRSTRILDTEIEAFARALEDSGLTVDERLNFEFALGHAEHGRGRYAKAFEHFRNGNAIKAKMLPFDPVRLEDRVNAIIDRYSTIPALTERGTGVNGDEGDSLARPIFIVGMPRSGSTLAARLIGEDADVLSLGESLVVARVLGDAADHAPSAETAATLRARIEELWRLAPGYRPRARVCDKMLGNLFRLGAIARIFPRATVVHCVRNPVATCLSCYFQNFDHGMHFSYQLSHLADFYRQYRRLMDHWAKVLPITIIELRYEDVVSDPQAQRATIDQACDLNTDRFTASAQPLPQGQVNTASFWQVRQPIYRSAVDTWQHYKPFIPQLLPLALEYPDPR